MPPFLHAVSGFNPHFPHIAPVHGALQAHLQSFSLHVPFARHDSRSRASAGHTEQAAPVQLVVEQSQLHVVVLSFPPCLQSSSSLVHLSQYLPFQGPVH